jgi:hypothetical protein
VIKTGLWLQLLILTGVLAPLAALSQIDPAKRDLIQIGYNQPFEGAAPVSAYAFYYRNQPSFLDNSNLTLRLAIAPVYLDSELGISEALGPNTDVGIGLAGGGFADSYYEVEQGKYLTEQSFDGDGGTLSSSIYHLFNPTQRVPLHGVLRGEVHYADYIRDNDTDPTFAIPHSVTSFNVRSGLRLGGMEPVMIPELALELSAWYEGQFRLNPGDYGFATNPYHINADSHQFWGRALFAYTLPKSQQNFLVSITGGGSYRTDRFSAYRLGGLLPLVSEFPLTLPGYFYQELSASKFVLFNGNYHVPIDSQKRWTLNAVASTAYVGYLEGLSQPGHWNTGVGGGIGYNSHSGVWKTVLDYSYGFDAIRTHGRGAQSIGLMLQINLDPSHHDYYDPGGNNFMLRGLNSFWHSFD